MSSTSGSSDRDGSSKSFLRVPTRTTMSILSGTNSTMSGMPGAGRTIGRVLYGAGRRLEPVLSRAAEALGIGPNAIAQRLMLFFLERHRSKSQGCTYVGKLGAGIAIAGEAGMKSRDDGKIEFAVDTILSHARAVCPTCEKIFVLGIDSEAVALRKLLEKMVEYAKHAEASTRLLAIEYMTALASAHKSNRQMLVQLGARKVIEEGVAFAQHHWNAGWSQLLAPSYVCIESLQEFAALPEAHRPDSALSERFGLGPDALIHRLIVMLVLHHKEHNKCPSNLEGLRASVELIVEKTLSYCTSCGERLDFVSAETVMNSDSWDLLPDVLQYIKHPDNTLRQLAIDYATAIAFTHPVVRQLLVSQGALDSVKELKKTLTASTSDDHLALVASADLCEDALTASSERFGIYSSATLRRMGLDPIACARRLIFLVMKTHHSHNIHPTQFQRSSQLSPLHAYVAAVCKPICYWCNVPMEPGHAVSSEIDRVCVGLIALVRHEDAEMRLLALGVLLALASGGDYLHGVLKFTATRIIEGFNLTNVGYEGHGETTEEKRLRAQCLEACSRWFKPGKMMVDGGLLRRMSIDPTELSDHLVDVLLRGRSIESARRAWLKDHVWIATPESYAVVPSPELATYAASSLPFPVRRLGLQDARERNIPYDAWRRFLPIDAEFRRKVTYMQLHIEYTTGWKTSEPTNKESIREEAEHDASPCKYELAIFSGASGEMPAEAHGRALVFTSHHMSPVPNEGWWDQYGDVFIREEGGLLVALQPGCRICVRHVCSSDAAEHKYQHDTVELLVHLEGDG